MNEFIEVYRTLPALRQINLLLIYLLPVFLQRTRNVLACLKHYKAQCLRYYCSRNFRSANK